MASAGVSLDDSKGYLVETLNGIYIGSHARTDDTTVLEKWNALSSFFGWLMFAIKVLKLPPPPFQ